MTARDEGTKNLDRAPPARLPPCEICGDPKLPYGATAWVLGQCYRGTGQLDWDSRGTVTCYRIGYLRMKERAAKAAPSALASEIASSELRRDVLWREAILKYTAHYGGIVEECEDCAPLRTLLEGNATPKAAPPSPPEIASLTREREEKQRLTMAPSARTPDRDAIDVSMRLFPAGYQREHAESIIATALRAAEQRGLDRAGEIVEQVRTADPHPEDDFTRNHALECARRLIREERERGGPPHG